MNEDEILAQADKISRERLKQRRRELAAQSLQEREAATQTLRRNIAIAVGLPGLTDQMFGPVLEAIEEYNTALSLLWEA